MNLEHLYVAGNAITSSELILLRKLESAQRPILYLLLCADQQLNRELYMQPCDVIMAAHIRGLIRLRHLLYVELTQRGKTALHFATAVTQTTGLPA